MNIAPLVLSRAEAAEAARTSTKEIDKAIRSGKLRAIRLGRRINIPVKALEEWLDAQPSV